MELAFIGGFAWAAWQVLGKLQRHAAKIEKNIDDAWLLGQFQAELKVQAEKKVRPSPAIGLQATATHHDHIFEKWRANKLKPSQITQLVSDLADLAQWAVGPNCFIPELRTDAPVKSWKEYGTTGKVHLLQAADYLHFDFGEIVKREAEKLGLANNWLWQVNEALPALSAEPGEIAEPGAQLAGLKTRLVEAEAAVRSAFETERRSQSTSLKRLVEPLAVAACMRKIQVLKVLLEEVGLSPPAANACLERIRTILKGPVSLTAASSEVAEQKAAAFSAVEAEANMAVEAVRKSRLVEIEAAAARVYRRALTLQSSSPSHWHASSDTPALHRLGLLAALLEELASQDAAGTKDGAAAASELADAVRKLTPQMRLQLTEEQATCQASLLEALTPPPPTPPPQPARLESFPATPKEAGEAEEEPSGDEPSDRSGKEDPMQSVEAGQAGAEEVASGAEEEGEAPVAPRPDPGVAAAKLRAFLEDIIRGRLTEAAAARKAVRVSAMEVAAKEAAEARDAANVCAKLAAEAAAAAEVAAAAAAKTKAKAAAAAEAKAACAASTIPAEPTEQEPSAITAEGEGSPQTADEKEAASQEGEREDRALDEDDTRPEVEVSSAAKVSSEAAEEDAKTDVVEHSTDATEMDASLDDLEAEAAAKAAEAETKAKEAAEAEAKAAEAEGKAKEAEIRAVEATAEVEVEEPLSEAELVDVDAVRKTVEAEARDRSEMEKEEAILQMQDSLDALRIRVSAKALEELVAKALFTAASAASTDAADKASDAGGDEGAAEGTATAAAPLDAGSRLLALETILRNTATATDIALPGAVAEAVAKVTAEDRTLLDAASTEMLFRLEEAATRVRLTADVLKLDMGPGCCEVLRRAEAWLKQQEEEATVRAARVAARVAKAAAQPEPDSVKPEEAAADSGEGKVPEAGEDAAKEMDPKEATGDVTEAATDDIAVTTSDVQEGDKVVEEEADADEAGPLAAGDASRLAEGRKLVAELLLEGLVLLELPAPSNKKLQVLRESVDALNPVDGDGAVQHRVITTLKEVVGQLGPIGGSVDARVREVSDEAERERLLQVRAAALAIFSALSSFLRLEAETWEGAKVDLEQAKKAVFGIQVERRAESLASAIAACGAVSERCASLARGVSELKSAVAGEAASKAREALQATAEQAESLSTSLHRYISYVRLREHALGVPVTSKPEADDDFELALPSLDEMQTKHSDGAVWLDLAGMGLPPAPSPNEDDDDAGEESEEATDSTAAHDAAIAALQERLNGWHETGLRLLSRGQAALVTLGGATLESGELRLTADIGLPSTKSLLQLGAEKIARLEVLAAESVSGPNSGIANPLHWYLLVSPTAVEPLRKFLEDNRYFGLQATQIHVFPNDVRPPLLNDELKAVLDTSGTKVARSQPGSGEMFLALRRSGALAHMQRNGVRCVEVTTVEDNLMARPLDPAFLGACAATAIDCAAKVAVPGVATEGANALPELYSRYLDLLGASSHLLPTLGDAVPALGTYYFSMDFVRRVDKLLRKQPLALYRLAPADKVPTRASAAGAAAAAKAAAATSATAAAAAGATGYRLERRLSDFASPAIKQLIDGTHVAMVAVDAGAEFAPVWGTNPFYRTVSPKAAVDALLLQHTRWVEGSGGAVSEEDDVVEVAPLVSYAGEGLAPLVEGKIFDEAYVHELQGFAAESLGTGSNLGWWVVPSLALYSGVAALKLLGKAAGKA